MGIIASFAVLSIGSRALDDRLDTEARRLSELFQLAADEAVLQGTEHGFVHTVDGYGFLVLKEGQWLQAEGGALRPRPLTEPFYLQLRVEGRAVPPAGSEKKDEPRKPQVMLLSSGEATAFSLELGARDFDIYYQLEGDALGRIQLVRKERPS